MTSMSLSIGGVNSAWRWPLASTLLVVLSILLAYLGTAEAIVHIWGRAQTYNHGFVVVPIALWLMWRQRDKLVDMDPAPAPWVLLPMLAMAVLWWVGRLVSVASAMQLALVVMIALVVPLVLGLQVARALAFPLCFLLFAVPIGDFMVPALMYWTAEVLVASLRLTGLPVYQEGQLLVIPSGRWAVVEACGGVRYLLATFMVGSLFAYLNYRSMAKRLVFMAVSLLVPIVANWVRAYLIVMLGHLTNNKYGTGDDHLVYGWGFFGVVILALFFFGARWSDADEATPAPAARRASAAPGTSAGRVALVSALALAVATWPIWIHAMSGSSSGSGAVRLDLPANLGSWSSAAMPAGSWRPSFVKATAEQSRIYRAGNAEVAVHVSYYRSQGDDSKLVSSGNQLVGGEMYKHWHVVSQASSSQVLQDRRLAWRTAELAALEPATSAGSQAHRRLTVWRLYWIDGHTFDHDIRAKLWQAWLAARGQSDEGAAIHLVSAHHDVVEANRELTRFVEENFNTLERVLAQLRDPR
jgi:exosortase A